VGRLVGWGCAGGLEGEGWTYGVFVAFAGGEEVGCVGC
jgi:hypothetical protein